MQMPFFSGLDVQAQTAGAADLFGQLPSYYHIYGKKSENMVD
jgi:hypothetical protein